MSDGATQKAQERATLLRYWLPVLLWMGLIFSVSSASSLPQHPDPLIELILKKSGHAVEYAILAALVWRALVHTTSVSRPWLWAFLFSLLYAGSDEFHQVFVQGRRGTWIDVIIDATGAGLAMFIARVLQQRRTTRRSARTDPGV